MNPYEILGVKNIASEKEIKKAYRKLSKQHHPDQGGDPKIFIEIQKAYELLMDSDARARYDKDGDTSSGFTPLSTAARNIIIQIWEQFLNCEQDNYNDEDKFERYIDIQDIIMDQIGTSERSLIRQKENAEISIAKFKRIRKNIKYSGEGLNILQLTIDHKIDNCNANIKIIKRKLQELDHAKQLIKEYSYDGSSEESNRKFLGNGLMDGFRL